MTFYLGERIKTVKHGFESTTQYDSTVRISFSKKTGPEIHHHVVGSWKDKNKQQATTSSSSSTRDERHHQSSGGGGFIVAYIPGTEVKDPKRLEKDTF
jgi:hypothetical protein